MNVHFIIHESFEAPAAFNTWTIQRKHHATYTRLHAGDSLPEDVDKLDLLVVMGGPQSPGTTTAECPHFDSEKEISFIARAIDNGKAVVGVCLGAQLIGESLGAKFEHSPSKEIGVFEIILTQDGRKDPLLSHFPERFPVGHWHADMPGLTPNARVLAASKGCPRQIVRYAPSVYGFQCHFEFTPDAIDDMINHCSHELEDNSQYVQSADELRVQDYAPANDLLYSFLDSLEERIRPVQPQQPL